MLEVELSGPHAELLAEALGVLEEGLAFADGADHRIRRERQQITKPPNPGVIERKSTIVPTLLEVF